MQAMSFIARGCLALASFIFASPAVAYLQFTYTSTHLPVTAVFYEGEPWQHPDYWQLEPFNFSFSFNLEAQDLSLQPVTHFYAQEFAVTLSSASESFQYLQQVKSPSSGRISLNSRGEVIDWDFLISIKQLITPDTDMGQYYAANHHEILETRGGPGSCNCDNFSHRFNVHTWHYIWITLAPMQIDFAGANSPANWTVTGIAVPEPSGLWLLAFALLVLYGARKYAARSYYA